MKIKQLQSRISQLYEKIIQFMEFSFCISILAVYNIMHSRDDHGHFQKILRIHHLYV